MTDSDGVSHDEDVEQYEWANTEQKYSLATFEEVYNRFSTEEICRLISLGASATQFLVIAAWADEYDVPGFYVVETMEKIKLPQGETE